MTAYKLPENVTESGHICGFYKLKEDEEFSVDNNLPEWSDLEAHFPDGDNTHGFRTVKDLYKAEDMTNDDAIYWDKEINDLMESLKRFQTSLAEGRSKVIDDVFKFQPSEEWKKNKFTEGSDLKASLAEIEKLDALLKIKDMEEKKAKLNRLQIEEESRAILANLTKVTMTSRIKTNSEEFLRLLYETDKPETGFDEEGTTGEEQNKPDEAKEGKKSNNGDDKNLKRTGSQQKFKFVERNIQLAKCGRGVLSLTDEEKLRIESLLVDTGDPKLGDAKKQSIDNPTKSDFYALDDESKSILSEIDQRLEEFSKEKSESLLENLKVEEDRINETANKNSKKKNVLSNQLLAINKLLSGINSITEQEVTPLSPGDINRLIEEASQLMIEVESRPSPDVITELVSSAKVLMPKFKYRFEEGLL